MLKFKFKVYLQNRPAVIMETTSEDDLISQLTAEGIYDFQLEPVLGTLFFIATNKGFYIRRDGLRFLFSNDIREATPYESWGEANACAMALDRIRYYAILSNSKY